MVVIMLFAFKQIGTVCYCIDFEAMDKTKRSLPTLQTIWQMSVPSFISDVKSGNGEIMISQ